MEQEKQTNRVSRIEEFLLDPEKTIFELLEEFENSVEEIRNALSQVDVANLETLKGEDGKTPERGVDYFTDEDLDNIEAFILDRIPVVGEDVPSPKQVNEYIDKQVAKIPRVKGDKGNPGTPGKPGKNGSPDSALDIIKKLRSLDKNQGLQLNDIRGLSKKIALLNEVSDEFTKLKEDLSNIKILTSGASSDGGGAVASVNGEVGVVVLTQDDIENGTTYVQTENNFTDTLLAKLTGLQTSYSFLSLTDTPSDYTGQAGKFVKVNATNDGLEFDSIPGGGDMLASVYDPTNVAGDAFDMDKMEQGTTNKFLSSAELTVVQNTSGTNTGDQEATDFDIKDLTDSNNLRTTWSGKQDALSFTPEDVANKRTSFQATPDDAHYPSEKLVKESLDAKANANNVLALDNTTAFTPDNDYEPATKKYVDDNAGGTKAIFEEETITPTTLGWNLSTASYDSVEFSVSSQDANPTGVTFKPDGTKMYIVGNESDKVYQYTLSTAWDLSTASYSVDFSVGSQDASPLGITFKPDGTKMYIVGATNKKVYQYTLSTAWDLSTASYSVDFSVGSQDTTPQGVTFKPDGTKMYIVGSTNDKVYQYTLSTAWDLSTASYSVDFSVGSQDASPLGITFKPDGTKMYIVGGDNDKVYQYTLSTAWDLSTASYSVDFSVGSQDATPRSVTFKPDGTKMYIVGSTNDKVYQYTSTYDLSLAEIDTDTYGEYYLTAIANDTKISMTGTPTLGQTLFVGLKDNGSAKTLTWDEINALGVTLPTQTTPGKQHIIGIKYIESAWRAIAVGEEE